MVQAVSVNWLAVLACTAVPFVLGGLWYGPVFGGAWQRLTALSDERLRHKGHAIRGYTAVLVGSFLVAWVLATTLAFAETADALEGLLGGFFCWLGFAAAVLLANDLMERRPVALTALNAGFWLLAFLADGAILGAWT